MARFSYYEKAKPLDHQFVSFDDELTIEGSSGPDSRTSLRFGGIQNYHRTDKSRMIRHRLKHESLKLIWDKETGSGDDNMTRNRLVPTCRPLKRT